MQNIVLNQQWLTITEVVEVMSISKPLKNFNPRIGHVQINYKSCKGFLSLTEELIWDQCHLFNAMINR